MKEKEIPSFYPASKAQWRAWLQENHDQQPSVWLIYYKMKSGMPTISWSEAVDEALCFGWIDSKAMPIDDKQYMQFFSKRKPGSAWSKINKEKVKRLIEGGLMAPAGYASIESAKQNGSWTILDDVENLEIPDDLEEAFGKEAGSKEFFMGLSKSVRKHMLQWVAFAKRAETRQRRINEIVEFGGKGLRP